MLSVTEEGRSISRNVLIVYMYVGNTFQYETDSYCVCHSILIMLLPKN